MTTQIELVDALVQAGRISEGLAAVEAGLELSDGAWATPELQRLKGELLLLQNGTVNAEPAADLFGQALSGARAKRRCLGNCALQRASPGFCATRADPPKRSPASSLSTIDSQRVSTPPI